MSAFDTYRAERRAREARLLGAELAYEAQQAIKDTATPRRSAVQLWDPELGHFWVEVTITARHLEPPRLALDEDEDETLDEMAWPDHADLSRGVA